MPSCRVRDSWTKIIIEARAPAAMALDCGAWYSAQLALSRHQREDALHAGHSSSSCASDVEICPGCSVNQTRETRQKVR